MKKISFSIKGHRTSVALEPEFYEALQQLARSRGLPLAKLVAEVDEERDPTTNLSSALRLLVLKHLQQKLH